VDALSIVSSPNVTTSGTTVSQLNGVSCAGPASCVAVGTSTTSNVTKTLIEHWNGLAWSIKRSPNPTGNAISLSAASCVNASTCVAVGQYTSGYVTKTLVEQWSGSTWTIKASANVAGASATRLLGVSCVSATSCEAV